MTRRTMNAIEMGLRNNPKMALLERTVNLTNTTTLRPPWIQAGCCARGCRRSTICRNPVSTVDPLTRNCDVFLYESDHHHYRPFCLCDDSLCACVRFSGSVGSTTLGTDERFSAASHPDRSALPGAADSMGRDFAGRPVALVHEAMARTPERLRPPDRVEERAPGHERQRTISS